MQAAFFCDNMSKVPVTLDMLSQGTGTSDEMSKVTGTRGDLKGGLPLIGISFIILDILRGTVL